MEPIDWRYRYHICLACVLGLWFRGYPHRIWPYNALDGTVAPFWDPEFPIETWENSGDHIETYHFLHQQGKNNMNQDTITLHGYEGNNDVRNAPKVDAGANMVLIILTMSVQNEDATIMYIYIYTYASR